MRSFVLLGFVALSLNTGCMGSTYRISGHELDRIGELPREVRGQSVRVVQQLNIGERTPDEDTEVSEGPRVAALIARTAWHAGRQARSAQHAQDSIRSRGQARVRPARRASDARTERPARTGEAGVRGSVSRRSDSGTSSESGESGSGSSAGSGVAIIAIVVIAATAAVGGVLAIALSEGARYDGWVDVAPDHILHLYQRRPFGQPNLWIALPTADLSPEVAAWADGAILDPGEGRVMELGRAPLDRRGAAFSATGMASRLSVLGDAGAPPTSAWGGGTRLAIGGFPMHQLGFLAAVDIQAGEGLRALNVRVGGEVQGFLPSFGPLNLGLYVEGGWLRTRFGDDTRSNLENDLYYGGGALVQSELTTRLALELRAGLWGQGRRVFPTVGVGFAIY